MIEAAAIIVFLVMVPPLPEHDGIRTIEVPITLDYDTLDSLAATTVFTGPEKQAVLVENAGWRIISGSAFRNICRDGLHHLAALVGEGKAPSLNYDSDISPDLKIALGIGQSDPYCLNIEQLISDKEYHMGLTLTFNCHELT